MFLAGWSRDAADNSAHARIARLSQTTTFDTKTRTYSPSLSSNTVSIPGRPSDNIKMFPKAISTLVAFTPSREVERLTFLDILGEKVPLKHLA